MIRWFFRKFLCPKDIHKVFLAFVPLKGPTKRYWQVPECKHCGRRFYVGEDPTYEEATHEEVLIYGRKPFIVYNLEK